MKEFYNTVPIYLNRRSRAIRNWQTLHIKIAFFKAMNSKMNDKEPNQGLTSIQKWLAWFDSIMISPDNKYKVIWDFIVITMLYICIFTIPFMLAF